MAVLSRGPGDRTAPVGMSLTECPAAAARAVLLIVTAAGCGGARQVPLPLRPQPIAYADTLPIPEPGGFEPLETRYVVNDAVSGEVSRGISLRRAVGENHEALNVTHFDDVVNSAWFEHRNDSRRMTPEEIFRGPTTTEGPDTTALLAVIAAKVQGISPGFTVRDARGDRYVVKFDPKGFLYLSSAAGVISNRLLYAAGYHVPEDYIFAFRSGQLHIDSEEGATVIDDDFVERPLTLEMVRDVLALTDPLPGGHYVAVASKYVPGPDKGPFRFDGTRRDDPNDHYDHQHRRELRGLDFAATLGSGTIRPHEPREGTEYNFDLWPTVGRLFTLGFYHVGWESQEWGVIDPSIGWMSAEEFDPATWKANWPNNAFTDMTIRDAYWGAKLVGSFSDEQIRAAVAAGRLPNAFASDTLTRILIHRRNRIVEHWYARVAPVENLKVEVDGRGAQGDDGAAVALSSFVLAFDDYGIRDGAWTAGEATYEWELQHDALDRRWAGRQGAVEGSFHQRLSVLAGAEDRPGRAGFAELEGADSIATMTIRVLRHDGGKSNRPATAYLSWGGDAAGYRVVGLEH